MPRKTVGQKARSHDKLDKQLHRLESSNLIHPAQRTPELEYIFRHALLQEAAYDSLLKADRRRLHQSVAETIENLYPDQVEQNAALLALHYTEAGDDDNALQYTLLTAQTAARVFAYAEASAYYSRAIDILSRLPDTEQNRRRRIDAILKYAELSWAADPPLRRFAYLVEAEQLLKQSSRDGGQPDGQSAENHLLLMQTQLALAGGYMARNHLTQSMHYYQEVLTHAEAMGQQDICMAASAAMNAILSAQGHYRTAEPQLARLAEALHNATDRWEWASTVGFLGVAMAMRGQIATGMTLIQDAMARARATHHHTFIAMFHLHLTFIHGVAGDWQRARDEACAAAETAERTGDHVYAFVGFAAQAYAESLLGQHEPALAGMARANEMRNRLGGEVFMAHQLALSETQIAFAQGRFDEAITRAEAAVALARSLDAIFVEGEVQRIWGQALAMLQPPRWDDAEAHMAASLQSFEQSGATLESARTRVAWGLICRARGAEPAARAHFAQAIAPFEAAGLGDDLQRVRRLLS